MKTPDLIFIERYEKFTNKYVSKKLLRHFLEANKEIINKIKTGGFISKYHNKCLKLIKNIDYYTDKKNSIIVDREIEENKVYFDNLFKGIDDNIMLDDEQRRAVVSDEDYMMVIAGAGSGKTTTMAAKVKYLVDIKKVDPDEILLISYTNKAVDELKQRVNKDFKIPVKVSTFHKFGIDILRSNTEEELQISTNPYSIISKYMVDVLGNDKELLEKFMRFFIYYFDVPTSALKFENLNQYHDYKRRDDFITLKSRLENDNNQIIDNRKKIGISIKGEFLRSSEEVMIANFLYLNGIDYEYEKPYPYRHNSYRQNPDFTIVYNEKTYYLEHFGIDKNNNNKMYSASDCRKYYKNMESKRKMHQVYNTTLLTTYSGSDLIDELKKQLELYNIPLRPKSNEEIYHMITNTSKDSYYNRFIYFCIDFIKGFKRKGYNENNLRDLKIQYKENERISMFLNFFEVMYEFYQKEMLQTSSIDFEDMINKTYDILCNTSRDKLNLNYSYIIIDEYQDISIQRFNLTKKVSELSEAKVVAVGDDWQAIFAFTGSDVSLFTEFKNLMGYGEELQITHTYRNSQELIDIAGSFVMKNRKQIKKRLKSNKKLPKPVKILLYDDTMSKLKNKIEQINLAIKEIYLRHGDKKSILMIGRYNFDKDFLFRSKEYIDLGNDKIKSKNFPNIDITFLSAHSSKGLGYDSVIIVNGSEGVYGFPSQIKDDEILKVVATEDKSYKDAEERRLFYVALTRTKNNVYIIAPVTNASSFIKELSEYKEVEIINKTGIRFYYNTERCPICGGNLVKRRNVYIKNYYECTNEKELCDFSTNNLKFKKRIRPCLKCNGYLVTKKNKSSDRYFVGCSNYDLNGCNYTEEIR